MEMINQDDRKDIYDKQLNDENNAKIKQQRNEGFSGENISAEYNPATLKTELDIDSKGNHNKVERARNTNTNPNNSEPTNDIQPKDDNHEIENSKSIENRDRNSDVATNRYPASHPENHENRGDMKLDE